MSLTEEQWKDLVRQAVQEWLYCECPYGACPVYPQPAMREASGWQPPEGVQPWQD